MLRKYYFVLAILMLLIGCTPHREELQQNKKISQSSPIAISEIAAPVSESYGTVEVIGGDEQTLREFIQRWFAPMHNSGSEDGNIIITLEEIPDNFPVYLPLPEGSDFIASVQTTYDWQILLDVPALSEDGLSSYTTILADANWYPAPEDKQGGGFVSVAENWSVFCNDETQETLTVQTSPLPSVQASMRLSLYTMDHYMCAPRGAQSVGSEYDVIPTLKIPAGAFLTSGGSSSGDGNAESSSEIRTTLTPMDLSIHFSDQLENDGWQRLDGDNTENFSWTSWKFTDSQNERWQGTLLIIDDPVDDELVFALIRMVKGSK